MHKSKEDARAHHSANLALIYEDYRSILEELQHDLIIVQLEDQLVLPITNAQDILQLGNLL